MRACNFAANEIGLPDLSRHASSHAGEDDAQVLKPETFDGARCIGNVMTPTLPIPFSILGLASGLASRAEK